MVRKFPISLTVIGITYEDVPVFVVPTDSNRRHVPVLIGTNVIRASKQDQQVSRGIDFMQQLHTENIAWHTAYINTVTSTESAEHEGMIGYARYVGRYPRNIPPSEEVDIMCQAPPNPIGHPYTVIVEGLPNNASCLRIVHLVADVKQNRQVPVRVCNISARPITIPRNSQLAQVSEVLQVNQTPVKG